MEVKMQREIKFRAWDKNHKYMAYQGTPDLETIQSFIHHFGDKKLMQFTGLRDNNGTKIFEGDLVEWPDGKIERVKFDYGKFTIGCDFGDPALYSALVKIVGNVYETPDLLK